MVGAGRFSASDREVDGSWTGVLDCVGEDRLSVVVEGSRAAVLGAARSSGLADDPADRDAEGAGGGRARPPLVVTGRAPRAGVARLKSAADVAGRAIAAWGGAPLLLEK